MSATFRRTRRWTCCATRFERAGPVENILGHWSQWLSLIPTPVRHMRRMRAGFWSQLSNKPFQHVYSIQSNPEEISVAVLWT